MRTERPKPLLDVAVSTFDTTLLLRVPHFAEAVDGLLQHESILTLSQQDGFKGFAVAGLELTELAAVALIREIDRDELQRQFGSDTAEFLSEISPSETFVHLQNFTTIPQAGDYGVDSMLIHGVSEWSHDTGPDRLVFHWAQSQDINFWQENGFNVITDKYRDNKPLVYALCSNLNT